MYRFWRWSRRFYADRNPEGVNPYGTPMTRSTLASMVQAYAEKLIVCRIAVDVREFERRLELNSSRGAKAM